MEELFEKLIDEEKKIKAEIRLLYGAFNKIEVVEPSDEEKEIGAELERIQVHSQMLKDRQDVIGEAGHNRYCPCCGIKLPKGYFKKLIEEIKTTTGKEIELREKYGAMHTKAFEESGSNLVKAIDKKETRLREVQALIEEIGR